MQEAHGYPAGGVASGTLAEYVVPLPWNWSWSRSPGCRAGDRRGHVGRVGHRVTVDPRDDVAGLHARRLRRAAGEHVDHHHPAVRRRRHVDPEPCPRSGRGGRRLAAGPAERGRHRDRRAGDQQGQRRRRDRDPEPALVARAEAPKALAQRAPRRPRRRGGTLGLRGLRRPTATGRQLVPAGRGLELPIARPEVTRSAHFAQSKVSIVSEIFLRTRVARRLRAATVRRRV